MNIVAYSLDRFQASSLAFWLLDGPRTVTLSNFETDWLDRDCSVRTYAPVGHVAHSIQLFADRRAVFVLRYFKWHRRKSLTSTYAFVRMLRRISAQQADDFRRFVANLGHLRPTEHKHEPDAPIRRESVPELNIRVETISDLGLQRYGFSAPQYENIAQQADLDSYWQSCGEISAEGIDEKLLAERYSISPFGEALDLNHDDFSELSSEFDLGVNLVSRDDLI